MFTYQDSFKDAAQLKTLEKIKSILLTLNIDVKLKWINFDFDLHIYSCTLSSPQIPSLFAAGKGHTQLQAECSAYGELIERLSTYYIVPRRPNYIHFQDEEKENNLIQAPFINLNTQEIKYFFNEQTMASSTGMAAGNTYPEAIVQSLCELFERYILSLFANNTLSINGIINNYNENNTKLINYINTQIGKVTVYDASLDSQFPCVLVTVVNYNECDVRCAAAPCVDTAIERCLIEIYGGIDIIHNMATRCCAIVNNGIDAQFIYYGLSRYGATLIPQHYLDLPTNISTTNFLQFSNNTEIVQYLKTFLNDKIGPLWGRTLGFLDFPVVKIYAENLVEPIEKNTIQIKQQIAKHILDIYNDNFLNNPNQKIQSLYINALEDIGQKLLPKPWKFSIVYDKLKQLSLSYHSNFLVFS